MSYRRYICGICNYVHEIGIASGATGSSEVPLADGTLPDSFRCPVCASEKDAFYGCTCEKYSIYEATAVSKSEPRKERVNTFVCATCDFIIRGLSQDNFNNLPADWTCPSCHGSGGFYEPCTCVPYPVQEQSEAADTCLLA